jgi:protoporphyrin/coproporphyrin ferrochelatase
MTVASGKKRARDIELLAMTGLQERRGNQVPVMSQQGVLLVNLGSPVSPSVADVRAYLDEFLMDARVLDYPAPIRRLIVSAFILPKRPKASAHAYQSIWWEAGSPLIVLSERLKQRLQELLPHPVALGMRYGQPSIHAGIQELIQQGVTKLLLAPLYPHYAMSTFETVVAAAHRTLAQMGQPPAMRILQPFYQDPAYIAALVESASPYLAQGYDHLLFSYHGIPERHLRKSDPTRQHCLSAPECCSIASAAHATCYRHQVLATTTAFAAAAHLPAGRYSVAFQSRLGRDVWLQPYTSVEIQRLASEGCRKLMVICPAFVSDCLETLEEIAMRGKETFLDAGGAEFVTIPCLNDHPTWVETLAGWCSNN